ncbi:MAG TPA: hypothetical protein VFW40_13050 [Capsulimonadaceae bacterium]|nr:hypothetical protein [Capsulimonadaceae bacterium]
MNNQGFGLYLFICALLVCDIAVHCVRAQPNRSQIASDTRTRRLEIVNQAGKVTARIDNTTEGTPEMVLYDSKGNIRYRVTANTQYAALALYSAAEDRQVVLAGTDHPLVAVYSHDRLQADLYSAPDGDSGLAVLDGDGKKRAAVAYHPAGDSAQISVQGSKKSAEMTCDHDAAVVSTNDQQGSRRSMLIYLPKYDTPMVVVNDKDKKPIWSAPTPPPNLSNSPTQ